MKVKILLSLTILCLFSSCHSNLISFDIENQLIIDCGADIVRFSIESHDDKDYVYFNALPNKRGIKEIKINEIEKNYLIQPSSMSTEAEKFELRPEMEYLITNYSIGDAALGKLIIRTDKNCRVVFANKTSCQ